MNETGEVRRPAFARRVNVEMDWLDDASFEIRGTLDDNVHSVAARLVVDFPEFTVRDAEARITRMPYEGYCSGAAGAIAGLRGVRLGRGFRRRAAEVVGGGESCNHLHTLVVDMAACAFQMNYAHIMKDEEARRLAESLKHDQGRRRMAVLGWMPQLRNSCYLFSEARDVLFDSPADGGAGNSES